MTDGSLLQSNTTHYEAVKMAQSRMALQEEVWDTVWKRKFLYLATVAISLLLAAFPLLKDVNTEDELSSRIGWVSDSLTFLRRILPSAFDPWISVFAQNPWTFLALGAALWCLIAISTNLGQRIQTAMQVAWRGAFSGTLPSVSIARKPRLRDRSWCKSLLTFGRSWLWPALYALAFAVLGFALLNRAIFGLQNYAGSVCRDTSTKNELARGEFVTAGGHSLNFAQFSERAQKDASITNSADKKNPFFYLPRYGVHLPEFRTSSLCQSMGVIVERPGTYLIRFESTDTFADYDGDLVAPYGYFSTHLVKQTVGSRLLPEGHMNFIEKVKSVLWMPFKREFAHPWFRVFARVGSTGGDMQVLNPDPFEAVNKINAPVEVQHRGELFLYVNDAVSGIPFADQWAYQNNNGSTRVLILRQ